jgi:hypothetical protein
MMFPQLCSGGMFYDVGFHDFQYCNGTFLEVTVMVMQLAMRKVVMCYLHVTSENSRTWSPLFSHLLRLFKFKFKCA